MEKTMEITKTNTSQPKKVDKLQMVAVEKFHERLNIDPKDKEIKTNKFAGNSKYLPISFIEMTLDEMFFGQWSTENFTYQVISNELVGSIDLVFIHPVTGFIIRRTGAAGVPIQMKSGSGVLDVQNKIPNTLVKDFPHLKSSCLANAARSIGKMFGRDLNRKERDNYNPLVLPHHNKEIKNINDKIGECNNVKELEQVFSENQKTMLGDTSLIAFYNARKKELK